MPYKPYNTLSRQQKWRRKKKHERQAESLAQTEADQLAVPMVNVSLSSSGTSDEIPVGEQSVPVSSDSQTVGAASFEYPALQRRLSLPTGRPTYPSKSALSLRCSRNSGHFLSQMYQKML